MQYEITIVIDAKEDDKILDRDEGFDKAFSYLKKLDCKVIGYLAKELGETDIDAQRANFGIPPQKAYNIFYDLVKEKIGKGYKTTIKISEFSKRIKKITKKTKIPSQWFNVEKIHNEKYIVVADNPGFNEEGECTYTVRLR
jgi:hypothetical protein